MAQAEHAFVEAAGRHRVGELRRIVGAWCDRRTAEADADRGLSPEEGKRVRRRLHASVTFGGMVRLDGDLDPETGETVLTALGAVLDAEARSRTDEDVRTPAQRRADALGEICRGWLDRDDRPTVAGERPHVSLIVDLQSLRSTGDRRLDRAVVDPIIPESAGLAHTGAAVPELLRRFTCDASVARVVLGPGSEPLDVGRRTSVVPPAIRRAVVVRDRGCRFPGCDRPPGWCDAHHMQHWADGGPTSLANLVLLCRRHHRLVHARGGFSLTLEHGRPLFRRPDGTPLGGGTDDRAPP